MEHLQNATLAGGVAVGACADLMLTPGGAVTVGALAGILSTCGFKYIQVLLERPNSHKSKYNEWVAFPPGQAQDP